MYQPENLTRWTRPPDYFGANWPEYFSSGVGRSRDSGSLESANFQAMMNVLCGESETVLIIRESHWAVGWVEWIALHQSDATALRAADETMAAFADYSVIDEELYSEIEWNRAADYWESLSPRDKVQFAIDERSRYHWLTTEPVWHYGRLDYGDLVNYGSTISEAMHESLRHD